MSENNNEGGTMIDKQQAKLNPSEVFSSPIAILDEASLSKAEKIEILHRWAYDISELSVAEEENMPGTDNHGTVTLEQIHQALHRLGEILDEAEGGTTKHGAA